MADFRALNQGKYIFSQLMSLISYNDFTGCVNRYNGDFKTKDFSCWKHFLCMAFGQLTHRESLSDTITCLAANKEKLYHLGIGKSVAKSTLSKAKKKFVFITNNFDLPAADIAQLYKHRWMIELFFKWIKQHLKINSFWGYSENAVKCQIWIAVSVYLLVAIVKKRIGLHHSLYEILQILSIKIFDKMPINQLFDDVLQQNFKELKDNQLNIFD